MLTSSPCLRLLPLISQMFRARPVGHRASIFASFDSDRVVSTIVDCGNPAVLQAIAARHQTARTAATPSSGRKRVLDLSAMVGHRARGLPITARRALSGLLRARADSGTADHVCVERQQAVDGTALAETPARSRGR